MFMRKTAMHHTLRCVLIFPPISLQMRSIGLTAIFVWTAVEAAIVLLLLVPVRLSWRRRLAAFIRSVPSSVRVLICGWMVVVAAFLWGSPAARAVAHPLQILSAK